MFETDINKYTGTFVSGFQKNLVLQSPSVGDFIPQSLIQQNNQGLGDFH